METEFKEVWEAITGVRRDVSELQIQGARAEERERAHVETMERIMKEFRDHAGKEEMTLARVEKRFTDVVSKLAEHDGSKKTIQHIFGNWATTLISLATFILLVYSLKPH